MYCCTHMVGSWVVGGSAFLLCTVLYCCTTYCCTAALQGGWMDRFVRGCVLRGCVHGFVGCFFTFLFVPRYTGPALAQFGVPLVRIKTLRVYHPTMPKQKEDFRHELHTARGRSIYRSTSTFTRSIHSQSMQVGLRSVCETEGGMILFESPKLVKIRTRSAIGVSLCGQNIPE